MRVVTKLAGAVGWLFVAHMLAPGLVHAAEPPSWFVPPPPRASVETSVTTRSFGSYEEMTVTAKHKAPVQRDPHGEEVHEYEPARSSAAAKDPDERPTTPSGYCGSAYQTVGGQAATGADMVGFGSGRCN